MVQSKQINKKHMATKKIHKPFVLKANRKGQHFVETVNRNRRIGYVTESYDRRQGADRAIISHLKLMQRALASIDNDLSRVGELIEDQTIVVSAAPKKVVVKSKK